MKTLIFLLKGFGFSSLLDFKKSAFGHMMNIKVASIATLLATLAVWIEGTFGIDAYALVAYVILISFEWMTGVAASLNRGEKHESRKLGRMMLKIAVYSIPIYICNTFKHHIQLPLVSQIGFNPFSWLHILFLLVIIWQLLVSVLENLDQLGFKWASLLLTIINKKFYNSLDIEDRQRNQ